MIKKTLIAAAIVSALAAFQPTSAHAGSGVNFYFGFSGQGHNSGSSSYYGGNDHYYDDRLSCREVRRILRRHYGYRRVRAVECNGQRYTFRARRDGCAWRVKVDAYTGQIVRVRAL